MTAIRRLTRIDRRISTAPKCVLNDKKSLYTLRYQGSWLNKAEYDMHCKTSYMVG